MKKQKLKRRRKKKKIEAKVEKTRRKVEEE